MREIKFRYWDASGHYLGTPKMHYQGDDSLVIFFECWEHDMEHVMQYTGLKDKNGVEIYTGDIVKGNNPILQLFIIVEFNGGLSILNTNNINDKIGNELIQYPTNDPQVAGWLMDSEVIGNKYENLELLK